MPVREWAQSIRTAPVRSDPKRMALSHRSEVYGEQFEDDLEVIWWADCNDCDRLTRHETWHQAISAALVHCHDGGDE